MGAKAPDKPSPQNLLKNGDFSGGIAGWSVSKLRHDDKETRPEKAPDMVAFNDTDGVGRPKGCLRVRLRNVGQGYCSWETGAVASFNRSALKGAELKVSFHARSVSGARRLSLRRLMGGGGMEPVTLSEQWQRYEGGWRLGYDTPFIVFALLPPEHVVKQYVQQGEFLLDNVSVEVIEPQE